MIPKINYRYTDLKLILTLCLFSTVFIFNDIRWTIHFETIILSYYWYRIHYCMYIYCGIMLYCYVLFCMNGVNDIWGYFRMTGVILFSTIMQMCKQHFEDTYLFNDNLMEDEKIILDLIFFLLHLKFENSVVTQ